MLNNFFRNIIICCVFLNVYGCRMLGIGGVEEVSYEVLESKDNKEIRLYPERIVAMTTVQGNYREAQRKSFRILAGYIFGKNKKNSSISMTAPVVQSSKSENIAMTAPVTQGLTGKSWSMTFAMPSSYKSIEALPTPIDSRVKILKLPSAKFAAIKYSWFAGEQKNRKKSQELKNWLENEKKYRIISTPFYAGYENPFWTLPFLRRNEMLIEVSNK